MRTGSSLAAVFFTVLHVACRGGDSGAEQTGTFVYDSAGVTILQNGDIDFTVSLLVTPEPTLQIGVLDGREEYQLFRVADIKRLSDGAIAVANGGSRELRIYEADGTHRATVGGAGQGPSEFRYPNALAILPGDTIQVQDFMDLVYFAPDGSFVRRRTANQQALLKVWEAAGGQSEGGRWLADGTLFAPIYHWDGTQGPPKPGPLRRPAMMLARVSADFSVIDTLGHFGGILQQYVDGGGARGVFSIVPPFATSTSWATGSRDGTIVVGDSESPQVHRFHADGTHSIVRWTAAAEPITGEDVEAWTERQRNADWTRGQLPRLERGWSAMDVPALKAYYGRISVGSDGTIWISPSDAEVEVSTLMAFDSQGRYAGTVEIPGKFSAHDSGPGWLLGLLRGESDVEYVQMYELRTR